MLVFTHRRDVEKYDPDVWWIIDATTNSMFKHAGSSLTHFTAELAAVKGKGDPCAEFTMNLFTPTAVHRDLKDTVLNMMRPCNPGAVMTRYAGIVVVCPDDGTIKTLQLMFI